METRKKTCFVVQGFGKKTDYRTGRALDLDASYEVIKEAVQAAGLQCIRADEIKHSGLIDKPMYEQILQADLVIADLSTSNVNAVYELGVRHAVRPRTTLIVAESQFDFAFDINRNLIRTYEHLGADLGRREARRFADDLTEAIRAIINDDAAVDSPLYTFVPRLRPPVADEAEDAAPPKKQLADARAADPSIGVLMQQAKQAMAASNFVVAKGFLQGVHALKPHDPYVIQQMALATYKSKLPTPEAALREAKAILDQLRPQDSHDTETLGLWGAIHKRLWNITSDRADLEGAIFALEKGFYLRRDYYNGINLAFLLNVRAQLAHQPPADAITDFVLAQRIRRDVIEIGEGLLEILRQTMQDDPPDTPEEEAQLKEEQYWLLATLWEAAVGIGDAAAADKWKQQAVAVATAAWMLDSTQTQLALLEDLLADPPLKHICP
jgi:hypothetical protein